MERLDFDTAFGEAQGMQRVIDPDDRRYGEYDRAAESLGILKTHTDLELLLASGMPMEEEYDDLKDQTDKIDCAIWDMPHLDPDRAAKFYLDVVRNNDRRYGAYTDVIIGVHHLLEVQPEAGMAVMGEIIEHMEPKDSLTHCEGFNYVLLNSPSTGLELVNKVIEARNFDIICEAIEYLLGDHESGRAQLDPAVAVTLRSYVNLFYQKPPESPQESMFEEI